MTQSRVVFRTAAFALLSFAGACNSSTGPKLDPLVFMSSSLPGAVSGEAYSEAIGAQGGDGQYSWDVVGGQLPTGLTLSADGVIAGVPESPGTYAFTVRIQSGDGQSLTADFSLVVASGTALAVANIGLAPALLGESYSAQLRATGSSSSTYTWDLADGALPPGLALVDGWIQGTPTETDTAVITLEVASGTRTARATFSLQVVANQIDAYQVTTFEVAPVPVAVQELLNAAIAKWESAIAGDLETLVIPPGTVTSAECGGYGEELNGTALDDLLLLVNIANIDGPGQILGESGPCGIRSSDSLPAAGILTLDASDLEILLIQGASDVVQYVITHEIGHVLGYGSLWFTFDLLQGAGTNDPRFTGPMAVEEWHALGGSGHVPVENQGGQGTADSHWRETIFGPELMTGYSEPTGTLEPLSRVTLASLGDLGYVMELSAADPFSLPSSLRSGTYPGQEPRLGPGFDRPYSGPVVVFQEHGPARVLRPR